MRLKTLLLSNQLFIGRVVEEWVWVVPILSTAQDSRHSNSGRHFNFTFSLIHRLAYFDGSVHSAVFPNRLAFWFWHILHRHTCILLYIYIYRFQTPVARISPLVSQLPKWTVPNWTNSPRAKIFNCCICHLITEKWALKRRTFNKMKPQNSAKKTKMIKNLTKNR